MPAQRAAFLQKDLVRIIKAFKAAGFSAPSIVIEPNKITAKPVAANATSESEPNPWDES